MCKTSTLALASLARPDVPVTSREWNHGTSGPARLGSGTAESHGGAMKIVAEYEIRESEVEVVEEEKQPWH